MATPDTAPTGEVRPFNFSNMSDAQIAFIGRSLIHGLEQQLDNGFGMAQDEFVGEAVIGLYSAEMGRLVDETPGRAKAFLKQAITSTDKYDQEVAVQCADELARRDFPLARDILAYANTPGHGLVEETDMWVTHRIERWATPEQMAELEAAQEAARDQWPHQIPPSLRS